MDPRDIAFLSTKTERLALEVASMPRALRGKLDKINGTTPQSRCNARRRLRNRMLAVEKLLKE